MRKTIILAFATIMLAFATLVTDLIRATTGPDTIATSPVAQFQAAAAPTTRDFNAI